MKVVGGPVHFCYFPPFSHERYLDLIAKCEASLVPTCLVSSLGKTLDGREMECVTVGSGPRIAWVIFIVSFLARIWHNSLLEVYF